MTKEENIEVETIVVTIEEATKIMKLYKAMGYDGWARKSNDGGLPDILLASDGLCSPPGGYTQVLLKIKTTRQP